MSRYRSAEYALPIILLGEQAESPQLQWALDELEIDGPIGLVSAGWEEDEFDDDWVRHAVRQEVVNSRLFNFAEVLFRADPEVLTLLRRRQDEFRRLREINQLQVGALTATARELIRREQQGELVDQQLEMTLRQLRDVDNQYMFLVADTIGRFENAIAPDSRASVRDYRARVLQQLDGTTALMIAGGHVGVLLNRLDLSGLLRQTQVPVIAWSGGAMALCDEVVFYHQFLPHQIGDVEIYRPGLNWVRGLQLFPRAAERLDLDNRLEMSLLSRRLHGRDCLLLDGKASLAWSRNNQLSAGNIRCLNRDGTVHRWNPT